ncbi:MAG TPA: efflux RND transporter periplasmic adaptor subunit, partial [Burkholderiaceae bacterium]
MQSKQEEWLDASTRERNARRSLSALTRDAQSVEADLAANAKQLQTQMAQIDRSVAAMDQEAQENEARRELIITAPQAGVISALNLHAGQAVQPGQTLLTLLPEDAGAAAGALEAELYAPSRTA